MRTIYVFRYLKNIWFNERRPGLHICCLQSVVTCCFGGCIGRKSNQLQMYSWKRGVFNIRFRKLWISSFDYIAELNKC